MANDVRYFPKGVFTRGNSQRVFKPKWQLPKYSISQAAISEVCFSHSARTLNFSSRSDQPLDFLAAVLCPMPILALANGPIACGASEGLNYPLGSCRLGKCTFWKLPLGWFPWKITPYLLKITPLSLQNYPPPENYPPPCKLPVPLKNYPIPPEK